MIRRLLPCIVVVSLSCSSSGNPGSGAGGTGNGSAGMNGQTGGNSSAGANSQAGNNGLGGANEQAGAGVGGAGTAGVAGGVPGGGASGAGPASAGAAGAGTAGAAGAGGASVSSPCGKLLPAQSSESVLQRGKNSQRTANFVEPSLSIAAVKSAKFGPDTTFNAAAKFTGNLEGVPLFVAGATPGKGMYIVASHGGGNSVITAIDETTGATLWSKNIPSGNGVRSTPVIDAASGTIYTALDSTTGGNHFEIHALSIANMGAEVAGWPVNPANLVSNASAMFGSYDTGKMIQRGALSLVNGTLYVPFGGVYGDGPPYKGFVVAINAANPAQKGAWSAAGDRSGLWNGGGLASDGTAIFATTSNGSDGTHQDSEEVVRITGMGNSTHDAKDVFYPTSWKTWDGQDNDFGASSPQVLQFSGTCQSLVVAPSKPGHLFFLDPANLGGANGTTPLRELVLATNANPNGEYKVFYAAPTAYISASGVHVALEARVDAACPTAGGDQLVSVKIDMSTTPPTPKVAWCVPVQGGEDRHSPISTSTDGASNAIVWFVFNSGLAAYDGDVGGPALFTSTPCGNVQKQTSPIAADGHVVVGADGRLCSYSVQP